MPPATIYPKADATTQWWEDKFVRGTFTGIEKILLHTTETTGWPGYSSGAVAPTLTYHPRLRKWRQHNKINTSARALADPDATVVKENRDNVIQIEIVAYADEAMAAKVGGLPASKLTDDQLRDLAEFIVWVRKQYGGPPLVITKFASYPDSYGANKYRLTGPQYDAYRGILGHSNAPAGDSWGNRHGDPGALNGDKIISFAKALEAPVVKPPVPPTTKPPVGDIVISDADAQKIAEKVWKYAIPNRRQPTAKWSAQSWLEGGNLLSGDAATDTDSILANQKKILDQQQAIMDLLSKQQPPATPTA